MCDKAGGASSASHLVRRRGGGLNSSFLSSAVHSHTPLSFTWRASSSTLRTVHNASMKCLYAGEVAGKIDALFKRVETVNASNGPFDALFCVGGFFAVAGELPERGLVPQRA